MNKFLLAVIATFGLSAGALACSDGKCPDGKCPMQRPLSQQLQLPPERAAKVDALQEAFKKDMKNNHAEHEAKLAEILTPEELAKFKALHKNKHKGMHGGAHGEGHPHSSAPAQSAPHSK